MFLNICSHNFIMSMHRKFNDDIFACFLVIMKNAVISFIKEYREPTLRRPCDVIDDVIVMKNIFLHNLGRYFHIWGQIEAAFNIWKFSKWPPFWARDKLFYRKSYRKLNIPGGDSNFKSLPTLWPCDVINDVMSAWNITCTTRHPIQCTCKILFVWHQSFIVKSSGQTSWQT